MEKMNLFSLDNDNGDKFYDVSMIGKSENLLYGKLFSSRLYFSYEDIDDISDDYVEYNIDGDICTIYKIVLGSSYRYSDEQYKKLFNDLIGFPVRKLILSDKEYIKYIDKKFIEEDNKIVIYTENQLVKGNISVKELIKMGYKFYTSKSDYWMTDFDKLGYITSDDEYDENGVAFYIGSVYFNRPGVIWFIMSKEELDDMHPYDDDMNNIIQFLPEEVILYDTYFREVQENELFKDYVFKGQYDKDDCISHVSNKDIMNKVNNRYVILEETNNIGLVSRVNKSDIINIKRV